MERFKAYVVPCAHAFEEHSNQKPRTRIFKSVFGLSLALSLAPFVNEAFLVQSSDRDYSNYDEFYMAVKKATQNLGSYCVENLMESMDSKGFLDVTRLIVDPSNSIKCP